jgi:pimeloyl-ACP methyl ester carboxylesterase
VNGALVREVLTEEEEQALRIQQQLYHEAKSRRNIPDMVEALMNDPTLVPSPEYASARKQVHEYLSEYSFVWVLDPAPQQPLDPPAWGRLHEIAVPTLLVVGEKDDIALHRFADKLEREISGVKRITMAGTHHLTNMEKPEEFNALVLDFLKTM